MFWKNTILTAVGGALLVVGAFIAGRVAGADSCKNTVQSTYIQKVEQNGKIERNIGRVAESDLDRRLTRWVR
jgi:hypothetical protein